MTTRVVTQGRREKCCVMTDVGVTTVTQCFGDVSKVGWKLPHFLSDPTAIQQSRLQSLKEKAIKGNILPTDTSFKPPNGPQRLHKLTFRGRENSNNIHINTIQDTHKI